MDILTLSMVAMLSIMVYAFIVKSKKSSVVVEALGDNVSTRIKASTFNMVADINNTMTEQAGKDKKPEDLLKELSALKNTLRDF